MRIAPFALLALAGCQINLDHRTADALDPNARACTVSENVQSCLDATQHADFTYVAAQILAPKCGLSNSCHQGEAGLSAGYLDFRSIGSAYSSLVNKPSQVDATRMLVVPGNTAQSFLLVMTGQLKPADADPPLDAIPEQDPTGNPVGLMPQGSPALCCQKLDAIAAWIAAGAPMM
ncbi:MAG TPA: hypothetical protein VGG74_22450 [Kofleriaceae bacterium]